MTELSGMSEIPYEMLYPWLVSLGRTMFILVAAYVGSFVARRLLRGARLSAFALMMRHAGGTQLELEKRADTIVGILKKAAVSLIWGVAIVMALREIGFDITPILAGAGVLGLAVGFGAQNLVRDVISGFFILVENQIRVNDVAVINGTGGLVEELNLRTTVLRSQDGVVHVFPNGAITTLSNMTREYSFYVLDIGVAYKEDTDRVIQAMHDVAEQMRSEPAYAEMILAPLEMLGVDRFTDSAVMIRARIKTEPIRQWSVGRELNRRIKKRFDELDIEIPFPHTSLYFGSASKPLKIELEPSTREELKQIVREVVQEAGRTNPSGPPA
jgi:small conductance mechanosensitive channel